jgi:DNA-binding NtrC family response regulator
VTVPDDFVLPAEVRAAMRSRQWRGNVRELIHFLECFMMFGEAPSESLMAGEDAGRVIPIHDLLGMKSEPALTALRHRFDRIYLPHIIKEAGGVVNAARVREVDRATLWRRMRDCGLRPRREGDGGDEG